MKNLKFAVPLGGIIILLGAEASFAGDETQRSSTGAIPAPADHSVGQQSLASAAAAAKGNESPTYLRDVLPIFMGKCVRCHNTEATVMYNWLDYKTAFGDRWEIRKRVWDSWHGSYYKQPMPAGNSSEVQTMTEEERRTIKTWVETGAAYVIPNLDLGSNVGFDSNGNSIGNLHGAPSGGGRIGWFHPWKAHYDLELGISGLSGTWDNDGSQLWSAGVVDAALHVSPYFEVKGEGIYTWQQTTDMGTIHPKGWWVQGGYKLSGLNTDLPLMNNVEVVLRYDTARDGLGTKVDRWTVGYVYYFSNNLLFEGDYEFVNSNDPSQNHNMFVFQLGYGF
jgi:hypothetical protein